MKVDIRSEITLNLEISLTNFKIHSDINQVSVYSFQLFITVPEAI